MVTNQIISAAAAATAACTIGEVEVADD